MAHQLPGLLAAALTLLLTWDLVRRLWNRKVATWAVVILISTVQFVLQARSGQIDAVLCAFTTLGLWGLIRGTLLAPAPTAWRLGFVGMGLGVVTKGVGLLPALALLPWSLARRRSWRMDGNGLGSGWIAGPILLVLVIAAWLVPLTIRVANAGDPMLAVYLQDLLFGQTVDRYMRPGGHLRPFWYFLGVVAWAWIPVVPALPWLVPAWRRRLARRDSRYLVLLGWVVLVLVFLLASGGKRGVYILPATPALALAVAPLAPGLLRLRGPHRLTVVLTLLLAAAAGAGASVAHASSEAATAGLQVPLALLVLGLIVGTAWVGRRHGPSIPASSASHPAAAGASYDNSDSVAQGGFDEEGTEAGTVHVV